MKSWPWLVAAAALVGCSGGATSSAPFSSPTAKPGVTNVVDASRGTLLLSLGAINTAQYYARFLRPGLFPSLAKLASSPVCDARTATATTVTRDFTKRNYTIAVAFYPAGDRTCSQAIDTAIELYYPNVALPSSSQPQLGSGYVVAFNAQGHPYEYDVVHDAVYADAPLNVDTQIDRFDPNSVPQGFARPHAGTFPATFPLDFPPPYPLPVTEQPLSFATCYYASVGSGAGTATIGSAITAITNPSFFAGNNDGATEFIGSVDLATVTVHGADAQGRLTYGAAHRDPGYAFNQLGRVAFSSGSFTLGAGNTQYAFTPIARGLTAFNFTSPILDSVQFSAGGQLLGDEQQYTDVRNQVESHVRFPASFGDYSVAAIDLLRHKPSTKPGPVALGPAGASRSYVYAFDGSPGAILDFTVIQ